MLFLPAFSSSVDCVGARADIVFVVDSSGSILEGPQGPIDNWQLTLNFVIQIVQNLEIGSDANRIGLVTFGNRGYNEFFLNSHNNVADVIAAINMTRHRDENTNTSGGLKVAREQQFLSVRGDRPDVQNVVILITDGKSTFDNTSTIPQAQMLRDDGAKIIAVGVTEAINETEVRMISSLPQELDSNYFLSEDFTEFNIILDAIVEQTCIAAEIRETPPPPPALPPLSPFTLPHNSMFPTSVNCLILYVEWGLYNTRQGSTLQ